MKEPLKSKSKETFKIGSERNLQYRKVKDIWKSRIKGMFLYKRKMEIQRKYKYSLGEHGKIQNLGEPMGRGPREAWGANRGNMFPVGFKME